MQMQQKNILEKELIKAKLGKRPRDRKVDSHDESAELEDSYRSNLSSDRSRSRSFSSESSYAQQSKLRTKRQSKFEDKRHKLHEYQIESSEEYSSISSDHYYH